MILVTGASGFLGQHLVRHLSAQGEVARALFHTHPPPAELKELPGIEWVSCDLLDIFEVEEVMKDVSAVYHCAAIVSFDPCLREKMLHFNPESTTNIVNQAISQGIEKLVHVSSVAALGRTGDAKKEINEEAEWEDSKYNSAYGLSKYLAEMEVWRGIGEGLNAVIINPGIILGPGNGHDLSSQLMKIVYREFPFYSKGVTSWVDVSDVVKAMTMLMASDVEAERFIISNGNFSYMEIFTLMAGALHKKPPRFAVNPFMTAIGWRFSALKSALLGTKSLITRETANNAVSLSYYNNQKLLSVLPAFSYTRLPDSIDLMARSFKESFNKK